MKTTTRNAMAFTSLTGSTITTSGIFIGTLPAVTAFDPRFDPSSSHGIGTLFRLSDRTKVEPN